MHPLDAAVMLALIMSVPLLLRFCAQAGRASRGAKGWLRATDPRRSGRWQRA